MTEETKPFSVRCYRCHKELLRTDGLLCECCVKVLMNLSVLIRG